MRKTSPGSHADATGWALSAAFTVVEQDPELATRFYPAFIALAPNASPLHLDALRDRMVALESAMVDGFHRESLRQLIRMCPR